MLPSVLDVDPEPLRDNFLSGDVEVLEYPNSTGVGGVLTITGVP